MTLPNNSGRERTTEYRMGVSTTANRLLIVLVVH
jgi:hypothetical protein